MSPEIESMISQRRAMIARADATIVAATKAAAEAQTPEAKDSHLSVVKHRTDRKAELERQIAEIVGKVQTPEPSPS